MQEASDRPFADGEQLTARKSASALGRAQHSLTNAFMAPASSSSDEPRKPILRFIRLKVLIYCYSLVELACGYRLQRCARSDAILCNIRGANTEILHKIGCDAKHK